MYQFLRLWILGLVTVAVFGSVGCGRAVSLDVKADPSEEGLAHAKAVRVVEINYKEAGGKSQLAETFKVDGLSESTRLQAETGAELKVDDEGAFEARAFSEDKRLLMSGVAPAKPDDAGKVAIVLRRATAGFGSGAFRAIRFAGAGAPAFSADDLSLRGAMDHGRCIDTPTVRIPTDSSTEPVRLEIERTGPLVEMTWDIALAAAVDPSGRTVSSGPGVAKTLPVEVDGSGKAFVSLREEMAGISLGKVPSKVRIGLYSNSYEGCLIVPTRPRLAPLRVKFVPGPGRDLNSIARRFGKSVVGHSVKLEMTNDSPYPITVRLKLRTPGGPICASTDHWPQWSLSDLERWRAEVAVFDGIRLAPGGMELAHIYGFWKPEGDALKTTGFPVEWEIEAKADSDTDWVPAGKGSYQLDRDDAYGNEKALESFRFR